MKISFSKIKQYIDSKINDLPNVVRTGSYNDLEDKPAIPEGSSSTPTMDTTNGATGDGTTWARSNHSHPKSNLYAETSHNHNISDMSDIETIPVLVTYTDNTTETLDLVVYNSHMVKLTFTNVPSRELLLVIEDENGNISYPNSYVDGFELELPLQTYKQYRIQTGQYMQETKWLYFYDLPDMNKGGEIIVDYRTLPQVPQSNEG